MYLKICVLFVSFALTLCAEKNSACITPNGENGTCIPVNSCRPIKQAITYFDQEAIEFARASQCGHEEGPLVCCGTAGKITGPPQSTTLPTIEIHVPSVAVPIDHLLLPDRSLCGLQLPENKASRAVTEIMEFPWLAALKYTKEDGSHAGYNCSGTLINQRYILTAAQCISPPGLVLTEIRLGEWKFSAPKECIQNPFNEEQCDYPVIDLKVVHTISHPYYNKQSHNNDIALVRLEKPIKYNDFVRPICLPPSDYYPPPPGTKMETVGWALTEKGNRSDVKLRGQLSMVGSEECNKTFPNFIQMNPNKVCVRSEEDSLCNGESGSPLMRTYEKESEDDQKQVFQEGIIYRGLGCGAKRQPALYMRVSRYIHWILSNLKQ